MNFNENCWAIAQQIPKGSVTTYAAIAHTLGCRAYRAVGNAMNKNPFIGGSVPCHRVVKSNGELGGFANNIQQKIDLLAAEGVEISHGKVVDFEEKVFTQFEKTNPQNS